MTKQILLPDEQAQLGYNSTRDLISAFRPVIDQISETADQRERDHVLPYDIYRDLRERGFGKLRLPHEYGGANITIPQLVALLIAIGEADANVVQSWRTHVLSTERYLKQTPGPDRDKWFGRIAAGDVIGGAWTEVTDVTVGVFTTLVSRAENGLVINGTKYYSTGSLLADWLQIGGVNEAGENVIAIVPSDAPGITRLDDWDGFGQQLTASGTTILDSVPVAADDVIPFSETYDGSRGWQQLVLLSALVGIGKAFEALAFSLLKAHQPASPEFDPLYSEVAGDIAAQVYSAETSLLAAAVATQEAHDAILSGSASARDAIRDSEQAIFKSQITIVQQVLAVANRVLDVVSDPINRVDGARLATAERLWRNARTISSHNPVVFKQRTVADTQAYGIDAGAQRLERVRR